MLLRAPSSSDDEELKQAAIPPMMLRSIGWARGLRILVREGLPPAAGFVLFMYILVRLLAGHDLPLELIDSLARLP